jgi:hypothetical protein
MVEDGPRSLAVIYQRSDSRSRIDLKTQIYKFDMSGLYPTGGNAPRDSNPDMLLQRQLSKFRGLRSIFLNPVRGFPGKFLSRMRRSSDRGNLVELRGIPPVF